MTNVTTATGTTTHNQFRLHQLLDGACAWPAVCVSRTGTAPQNALSVTIRRGAAPVAGPASVGRRNPLRGTEAAVEIGANQFTGCVAPGSAERRGTDAKSKTPTNSTEGSVGHVTISRAAEAVRMMILQQGGGMPLVSCKRIRQTDGKRLSVAACSPRGSSRSLS
jgi:hypothetical protein